MSRMISVHTRDLAGSALDWAVSSIEGDQQPVAGQMDLFALPDAEQLLVKHGIWCERGHGCPWLADSTLDPFNRQSGETRTIAVFRAVVFAKHGATVKVPAELV